MRECLAGFIETFHSYASRITVFAMILFSMLVYQFYLTYIVSFLLVVPPKTIHTLHQLVENGFAVALENVPKNVEYLNVAYSGASLATRWRHTFQLIEVCSAPLSFSDLVGHG